MLKRFVVTLLSSFFIVAPVLAVDSTPQIPEFNTLCWHQAQCYDARATQIKIGKTFKDLSPADQALAKEAFIQGPGTEPCVGGDETDPWGRCLPAGVSKTEIAFGGKKSFVNIGDFIKTNFNYALIIAGILATVMVIVAGIQWTTSGGNAEMITGAKNRIAGAMIGLFIAYSSYFILNTINPALVAFRLPQTWMVRPSALSPQFCSAAPNTTKFGAPPLPETDQLSVPSAPGDKLKFETAYDKTSTAAFQCGRRFYMAGGGAATCFGNFCNPGTSCVFLDANDPAKKTNKNLHYGCKEGQLFLNFSIDGLMEVILSYLPVKNNVNKDWLKNNFYFYGVCQDLADASKLTIGKNYSLSAANSVLGAHEDSPFYTYNSIFNHIDTEIKVNDWGCQESQHLVGFILRASVDKSWWPSDSYLNIGYNSGGPVYGIWGKEVTVDNYIPKDLLVSPGISMSIPIGDNIIKELNDKNGTYPQ